MYFWLNLDFNLDYIQKDDTSVALLDNEYRESILNGAYPVLSDKLIPVTIESDGTVKRQILLQNGIVILISCGQMR